MNGLAIRGGNPVRTKSWPRWPKVTNNTEKIIADVLHSGRWAISGSYAGQECFERKFARAFASYNGTRYCVPCTSGSTALTLALRALDIGPDQEVLVPGLTWVACPAAVCEVGAIPILVDIDEAVPGFIDEESGAVTFDAEDDAANYGVLDEVARRVFLSSGRVLAVRREDVPGGSPAAAILRYAV